MDPKPPSPRVPEAIELPAPTVWPMITAFGITLAFAGLVTSLAVSGVGLALLLTGAVGWWRDVLPREKHVREPVRPPEQRAPAIALAAHGVEQLQPGRAHHRARIPERIHPYRSGLAGGLVGAVAMAVVACAYGLLSQGSIWYPINLLAAGAMPALADADVETLKSFQTMGFAVAFFAHGIVSLLVGLLFAVLLPMLPRASAFWGSLFSPILWSGLLFGTLRFVNPALEQRIDWLWFIASQVAFGLACGYVVAHSRMVETMQAWPLAARAGIEAPGVIHREEER